LDWDDIELSNIEMEFSLLLAPIPTTDCRC